MSICSENRASQQAPPAAKAICSPPPRKILTGDFGRVPTRFVRRLRIEARAAEPPVDVNMDANLAAGPSIIDLSGNDLWNFA